MANDPDYIPFLLTAGHYEDQTLLLRFPYEHRDEVVELLEEQGISHTNVMEFSADTDLYIEAVKVLTGPAALAALTTVIVAFLKRHQGKKIKFARDGRVEEISGYSKKDIEQLVQDASVRQVEIDEKTRKMLESME